jgi:O-antigen chain-terminating methyltransferase
MNPRKIKVYEILKNVGSMIETVPSERAEGNILVIGEEITPWSTDSVAEEGLEHNLEVINSKYDVRTTRSIDTPRKLLRPAVLRIKRLAYNEIKAAFDPILEKQVTFNASVVRCINNICKQTDAISTQLDRFSRSEQRLTQLEHAIEAIRSKQDRTHTVSEPMISVSRSEQVSEAIRQLSDTDFVALAYEYLLGRAPGQPELSEAVAYLKNGGSRTTFIESMLKSSEFWRKAVPTNFRITTEREVEIPWCLARIGDAKRVLDVGCAESDYLDKLSHLELYGVDVRNPVLKLPRNFTFLKCDITRNPFTSGFFDLVICISTLEHIGLRAYGQKDFPDGDLSTLNAMMDSLRSGGRLLLSVPYGRLENHGWLRVYDEGSWAKLKDNKTILEEAFFKYDNGHYSSCSPTDLIDVRYIDPDSPLGKAGGLVCAEIRK